MSSLLKSALRRFFRFGSITFITAAGDSFTCGDGTGTPVTVRFTTASAQRRLLLDPEMAFGEIYMDGELVIEQGSITDVLAVALAQPYDLPRLAKLLHWQRYLVRRWHQFNPMGLAKRRIQSHYDLDSRLYSLFLDSDRQYSCAYFERPDMTLDEAQLAKRRHVTAKLLVKPDQRVLDIGSGWGGLGLYIAEIAGGMVTGVTLSNEQFEMSNQRAKAKGLA